MEGDQPVPSVQQVSVITKIKLQDCAEIELESFFKMIGEIRLNNISGESLPLGKFGDIVIFQVFEVSGVVERKCHRFPGSIRGIYPSERG